MNIHKVVLRFFFLVSAAVKLGSAFTVPQYPSERYMTRGIAKSNINLLELGIFRPHQDHYICSDNYQQSTQLKLPHAVKTISQKFKSIRSFLSFRFFWVFNKNKKRYFSIVVAAIIAAGACPSGVTAETSTNPTSLSKAVVTSIRTTMDSEIKKSVANNSFLQYDTKAPNNYFEDVDVDYIFETNQQATSGSNDILQKLDSKTIDGRYHDYESKTVTDGFSSALPIVEDVAQILTTENNKQQETDLLILDDRMVKRGIRNIAIVSGGTAAFLSLSRKTVKLNSEDDNDIPADVLDGYDKIIPLRSENNTDHVAECEADKGSLPPLIDEKVVETKTQPKSPNEEAILAARYAAISTVEERAYQILVDLGMIEVRG